MSHPDFLSFQDQFAIPKHNGQNAIYFCGNSLGLLPLKAKTYMLETIEDWANLGVKGHFEGDRAWSTCHEQVSDLMAPLAGCLPHETVATNSLSVNLHLLLASFFRPQHSGRTKILSEKGAFSSDQYIIQTHLQHWGLDPNIHWIEIAPKDGAHILETTQITQAIEDCGPELAIVLLPGVHYYTGQLLDMQAITKSAHSVGAYAGFDLAHAIGNVTLKIHEWNVDFAAWCSYKYLNAGPGSIGGLYIHEKYAVDTSMPRLGGWWGHDAQKRFLMEKTFEPIASAAGWQLSNPSPLLMASLKASLEIFAQIQFDDLIAHSHYLTTKLRNALEIMPHIQIITPAQNQGCQLSVLIEGKAKAVFDKISKQGVVCDFRHPDVIRLAPTPLYNTAQEIDRFLDIFYQAIV